MWINLFIWWKINGSFSIIIKIKVKFYLDIINLKYWYFDVFGYRDVKKDYILF